MPWLKRPLRPVRLGADHLVNDDVDDGDDDDDDGDDNDGDDDDD